jgi:mannose-6-phosphate isomerase-like protein (cupin superfamily)
MNTTPENLSRISDAIKDKHKNVMIGEVNNHCVRLAVVQDTIYEWHHHPNSDELFIVLEGELTIEFQDEDTLVLKTGDFHTVSRGKIHRTRARGRTVNLCIEATVAELSSLNRYLRI